MEAHLAAPKPMPVRFRAPIRPVVAQDDEGHHLQLVAIEEANVVDEEPLREPFIRCRLDLDVD
jgi:hypothetical protein